jgi:hypothetical protein
VRAVVGIAWQEARDLGDDELRAIQQAGEAMP